MYRVDSVIECGARDSHWLFVAKLIMTLQIDFGKCASFCTHRARSWSTQLVSCNYSGFANCKRHTHMHSCKVRRFAIDVKQDVAATGPGFGAPTCLPLTSWVAAPHIPSSPFLPFIHHIARLRPFVEPWQPRHCRGSPRKGPLSFAPSSNPPATWQPPIRRCSALARSSSVHCAKND